MRFIQIILTSALVSPGQGEARTGVEFQLASESRSSTIPIVRVESILSMGTRINRRLASLTRSVTFRTNDPRPYELVELLSAVFLGRLATGDILSFSGDGWEARDSMTVRPASEYTSFARPAGPPEACPPTIAGYAQRYIARTYMPEVRLGIWQSYPGAQDTLVVAFASDVPCRTDVARERRFRILLRGPIPWRLAALEQNLDSPPSLILVSDARVGEPITFALYDVRPRALWFAQPPTRNRRTR